MKNFPLLLSVTMLLGACNSGLEFFKSAGDHAPADQSRSQEDSSLLAGSLSESEKKEVQNLSMPQVYARLLDRASDEAVTVKGIKLAGVKSMLVAMKPAFEELADRYGSFGEMMQENGASLTAKPSVAQEKIILEETAGMLEGTNSLAKAKDIIVSSPFEVQTSYEDFEMNLADRRLRLADPEIFTGSTVCGSLKAVGSLKSDLGSVAVCAATVAITAVKDAAEVAAASTGVGAPEAAAVGAATAAMDVRAFACIGGFVAWLGTAVSQALHEGNCVNAKTGKEVASAHPKCENSQVWDDTAKKCVPKGK